MLHKMISARKQSLVLFSLKSIESSYSQLIEQTFFKAEKQNLEGNNQEWTQNRRNQLEEYNLEGTKPRRDIPQKNILL